VNKYRPEIDDISCDHDTKLGTHYPDLEPGNEFQNQAGYGYKSLA